MATPGLARKKENTPRDGHGWYRPGECGADDGMLVIARWNGVVDVRGLSVLPVLVGVLLTFVFELLGIDGAGGYSVDPTRHQFSVKPFGQAIWTTEVLTSHPERHGEHHS